MLRKFLGGLDIPFSLFEASGTSQQLVCHVATSPLCIVRAMAQHRSQWVWCVLHRLHDGCQATRFCEAVSSMHIQAVQQGLLLPCRFRKLFMTFSRYTYVNTLRLVHT